MCPSESFGQSLVWLVERCFFGCAAQASGTVPYASHLKTAAAELSWRTAVWGEANWDETFGFFGWHGTRPKEPFEFSPDDDSGFAGVSWELCADRRSRAYDLAVDFRFGRPTRSALETFGPSWTCENISVMQPDAKDRIAWGFGLVCNRGRWSTVRAPRTLPLLCEGGDSFSLELARVILHHGGMADLFVTLPRRPSRTAAPRREPPNDSGAVADRASTEASLNAGVTDNPGAADNPESVAETLAAEGSGRGSGSISPRGSLESSDWHAVRKRRKRRGATSEVTTHDRLLGSMAACEAFFTKSHVNFEAHSIPPAGVAQRLGRPRFRVIREAECDSWTEMWVHACAKAERQGVGLLSLAIDAGRRIADCHEGIFMDELMEDDQQCETFRSMEQRRAAIRREKERKMQPKNTSRSSAGELHTSTGKKKSRALRKLECAKDMRQFASDS